MTPEQAQQIPPEVGQQMATHAEKNSPSIVDSLSNFYAQHTTLVKTLGGAAYVPGQVFEPLIGCGAAARLLGNIHVKTLQRYARRGTVPGYRVAGHWYFRATELDAWLQSRINSLPSVPLELGGIANVQADTVSVWMVT